jgi:hypothetical protein
VRYLYKKSKFVKNEHARYAFEKYEMVMGNSAIITKSMQIMIYSMKYFKTECSE